MRACASFGVSLVVRLGAMSVAFEGGIVSAGGLQYRQLPPAARPSAHPTAVDALMDALDEQYEEDKSFTEMFDPAQSKVQCAFAFEVAARSVQTGRSDKGCRVQSSVEGDRRLRGGDAVRCRRARAGVFGRPEEAAAGRARSRHAAVPRAGGGGCAGGGGGRGRSESEPLPVRLACSTWSCCGDACCHGDTCCQTWGRPPRLSSLAIAHAIAIAHANGQHRERVSVCCIHCVHSLVSPAPRYSRTYMIVWRRP